MGSEEEEGAVCNTLRKDFMVDLADMKNKNDKVEQRTGDDKRAIQAIFSIRFNMNRSKYYFSLAETTRDIISNHHPNNHFF